MPRITRTELPPGYRYIPDFLSASEERELLCFLQSIAFAEVGMHGVVAKRRVARLGWIYGYVLSGAARDVWQHSIPATKEPRFSMIFRTVKHIGIAAVRR